MPHLKVHIMNAQQTARHRLRRHDMMQIRSRVMLACRTPAVLRHWPPVQRILGLLQIQLAAAHQRTAKTRRARREHTVEHVDAQRYAHHQIGRKADAHQVARFRHGQQSGAHVDRAPELVLALAAAQAADRKAARVPLQQCGGALLAQLHVQAALLYNKNEHELLLVEHKLTFNSMSNIKPVSYLHNGENALLVVTLVRFQAAVQPPDGAVHGLLDARSRRRRLDHIVQLHHDVSADGVLDGNGMLGSQLALAAVERRLKVDARLGDLGQLEQRDHLEAARVGEQTARPAHKFVQAASLLENFGALTHACFITFIAFQTMNSGKILQDACPNGMCCPE